LGTVLVLALAVGVGVLVYRLTAGGDEPAATADPARSGEHDVSTWTGGEPSPAPADAGRSPAVSDRPTQQSRVPEGYIPVSAGAASWHDRLGGAMGLVIAVAVGAIALALSLWAVVVLVARLASGAGA
jgi:hypothetical protein